MKFPPAPHRWNLTPEQVVRLQRRLAARVRSEPLAKTVRYVAGGDVSFFKDGTRLIAGWVVWEVNAGEVVESVVAERPVRFPYVPGLLSFREAPGLIAAARKLRIEPDVFMLDGQGLAHPRRFGLACHVGLLMDRPTLGCAKSRLCGEHDTPGDAVGASCPLIHDGEMVGCVLRTRAGSTLAAADPRVDRTRCVPGPRAGVKPVYVSIGHRIALEDAVGIVLRCCAKYRLPEPTRLAHQLVTREREGRES